MFSLLPHFDSKRQSTHTEFDCDISIFRGHYTVMHCGHPSNDTSMQVDF